MWNWLQPRAVGQWESVKVCYQTHKIIPSWPLRGEGATWTSYSSWWRIPDAANSSSASLQCETTDLRARGAGAWAEYQGKSKKLRTLCRTVLVSSLYFDITIRPGLIMIRLSRFQL